MLSLFSSFPIKSIDLLKVRGYTCIDQGNSPTHKTVCQFKTDRSHLCFFWIHYGYSFFITQIYISYLSSRKEIDRELTIFMGIKDTFLGISLNELIWNLVDIVISDQVFSPFSSSFEKLVHFQHFAKHWKRSFHKMLNSFRKSVFIWENKNENTSV